MNLEQAPWCTPDWWVSHYNFDDQIRAGFQFPKRVQIHDATLRDGEQTPGVVFRVEDKVAIAKALNEAGIDRIEAGMPAVSREDFEAIRAISKLGLDSKIMAFSRAVTRVGPSGAGQLAKMVNQVCIAGLVQGLSEGIAFGMRSGLDMKQVLEVIGKGAAQSWQMDNRGSTMVDDKFDFGFAVDWMRKDLGLVLDEARRNGAHMPVTALVDQFYGDIQAMGGRRWDTSSLIKRLR